MSINTLPFSTPWHAHIIIYYTTMLMMSWYFMSIKIIIISKSCKLAHIYSDAINE